MFEDQSNNASSSPSLTNKYQMMGSIHIENIEDHDMNHQQKINDSIAVINLDDDINDPVEFIDLDEEENEPRYQTKLKSMELLSAISSRDHDISPELNNIDEKNVYGNNAGIGSRMKADDTGSVIVIDGDLEVETKIKRRPPMVILHNVSSINFTNKKDMAEKSTEYPSKVIKNNSSKKKRFKCHLCPKTYIFSSRFNLHMRAHCGEKPFRCEICQKGFTSIQQFRKHRVTHINEFPFYCRICFSGFFQKCEKETHEKSCKMRRYECHMCKKCVTMYITNLKRHMQIHNGKKPFQCEVCKMVFSSRIYLKKHVDIIHTTSKVV